MELRTRITDALKQAMKDKAVARLSTLRLINAAIKDKDIAARADGGDDGVGDAEVLAILGKMSKQRSEEHTSELQSPDGISARLRRRWSPRSCRPRAR